MHKVLWWSKARGRPSKNYPGDSGARKQGGILAVIRLLQKLLDVLHIIWERLGAGFPDRSLDLDGLKSTEELVLALGILPV